MSEEFDRGLELLAELGLPPLEPPSDVKIGLVEECQILDWLRARGHVVSTEEIRMYLYWWSNDPKVDWLRYAKVIRGAIEAGRVWAHPRDPITADDRAWAQPWRK